MRIEVLGVGCPKCVKMYEATVQAVAQAGCEAEVQKVYDPAEIARYGVYAFPALVVDGVVRSTGKLLAPDAIARLLEGG